MGAIGVITMSGAPESHLGILSREFQTPCIMTAHLTDSDSRYEVGNTDEAHFEEIVQRARRQAGAARLRERQRRPRVNHRQSTADDHHRARRATYKQRYEPDDDGLRFQDLTYTGNFIGLRARARRHPRRQDAAPA